ncbi:MAG TPA: hypothetical protein VG370_00940 [Chloroflexota bacterium]|nr:hypothetical protein [Chloroflexota bacterium]
MPSVLTDPPIVTSGGQSVVGTAVGVVVVLLLALLIGRELVRAYDGSQTGRWMRRLDAVIWPLLVAFGVIVVARFGRFLQLF